MARSSRQSHRAANKPTETRTGPNAHLPEKICVVCRRSFKWRKKWERDWASVKYCSKRCAGVGERT